MFGFVLIIHEIIYFPKLIRKQPYTITFIYL